MIYITMILLADYNAGVQLMKQRVEAIDDETYGTYTHGTYTHGTYTSACNQDGLEAGRK